VNGGDDCTSAVEAGKGHIGSQAETYRVYACPTCKRELELRDEGLQCRACAVTYPILDGIPDFVVEELARSGSQILRDIQKIDWLARIYETKLWYPLVLNLYGGWRIASLEGLARDIADIVGSVRGLVLDAACGPGTYGRRIASESRGVYGIDVSMGMLRRGVRYVKRDRLRNIHFARAKVEALPFPAGLFDAAICAGSLHLFPDTLFALREIGRTMKHGAPLAVMTFAGGTAGILKFRRIRDHVEKDHGVHIFEFPELDRYLAEAGFENFRPQAYGSILVFSARKKMAP
jgi:SAM-dependent methyltransferase